MSIPELRQADNGFWYIHWTEGRRSKRESTRTKELSAAKAYLAEFLLNEQNHSAKTAAETFTVAELWGLYFKKHGSKVENEANLKSIWKKLEQHFGRLTLPEITQDVVESYEKKRREGRIGRRSKDSTIGLELRLLRACFNWCADPERRIIDRAQVPFFRALPDGDPRDRWLRHEEIQRLLQAAADIRTGKYSRNRERLSRLERFLWLALETAARKTAIYELTWDRVDFETGVIHLNVPGRKKTKKRRADVPISSALRPILERAYAERINNYVLDSKADIWRYLQTAAAKAGFAPETKTKWGIPEATGISPHILRHTAATHMARRGVPLWKIAKILGNSLHMVEKVYAKHCPDDLREAVDLISGGVLEVTE